MRRGSVARAPGANKGGEVVAEYLCPTRGAARPAWGGEPAAAAQNGSTGVAPQFLDRGRRRRNSGWTQL